MPLLLNPKIITSGKDEQSGGSSHLLQHHLKGRSLKQVDVIVLQTHSGVLKIS